MSTPELFFDALAEKIALRVQNFAGTQQRLLSLEQASEYLGMTPEALRQKVNAGEVKGVDLDRRLRFDRYDLDELIENKKTRSR